MKRLLVPDASVILKWILKSDEDDTEKALAILSSWVYGEVGLLLPSLWAYEVGNIVGRKLPGRSDEVMRLLLDYHFPEVRPDAVHVLASLDLMRQYAVTFYDASYHAVALRSGGLFVTADEVYVGKARPAGRVVSLRELEI